MYFNAILTNIKGSISLQWSVMFPISSETSFLDIFMDSEFSECMFLTIQQLAPVYEDLQYFQNTSELYEFRWKVQNDITITPQQYKQPNLANKAILQRTLQNWLGKPDNPPSL